MSSPSRRGLAHAVLVVAGFTLLFCWVFLNPIITGRYLAESDLYEYYLPVFLSPITIWSSYEFGGLPAFADPGDFTSYPLHFLFARVLHSWTGLAISAYVLAGVFTYAYMWNATRSRSASLIAGLAYAMSEAMLERLPHLSTLHAFAWLPLLALAIDRLRDTGRARWIGIGAFAAGCCFLAGHPQPAVYTYYVAVAYAVVGGVRDHVPRRYYLHLAAMFLLGGALTGIKALPFVESSFYLAREVVNYGQFVSHSNSGPQMLSLLFPSILHDGREAPLYVGLATLALAAAGATTARRDWRAAFWLTAALVAAAIGAGAGTPIARVAYDLPLFDKFRVAARFLFVFAFGAAVLAGFGVTALRRRAITPRTIAWICALLLIAIAAGTAWMTMSPAEFRFEARHALPVALPVWSSGIWVQFAIAFVTIALMAMFARAPQRSGVLAALAIVLAADLLYSLPYPVTFTGIVPITISRQELQPSVHARALDALIEPTHQRLLAVGGTQHDAVVPAVFARLWRIPIAGGYGPMLLRQQNEIAHMGTNGSVTWDTLSAQDLGLDLLAVRYILVRQDDIPAPSVFERDGISWSRDDLDFTVGRPDCGQRYTRTTTIGVPPDATVQSLALVGYLRCSEDVPQGTEVASIETVASDGSSEVHPLLAGVDLAEHGLSGADIRARAKHRPAILFDDPDIPPDTYVARIRLRQPARLRSIVLRAAATGGWTSIARLSAISADGHSIPMTSPELFLRDSTRWRAVQQFRTSRETDRGVDVEAPDEQLYTVYENLRAMPRAWIVPSAVALTEEDMVQAIHYGQLPDGRRFDPRQLALVEPRTEPPLSGRGGATRADVTGIDDGRITVDATAANGGFLVLSEAYYPGWRASIDGHVVPVQRTDVALQGVALPPGHHHVVFELVSWTLRAGIVLSVAALALVLVLVARA